MAELQPAVPPIPAPLDDLVQSTGETGAPAELQPAEGRRIPIDRRGRRGDRGGSVRWPQAEPGVSAATAAVEGPLDVNAEIAPVPKDLVEAPGNTVDHVGAAEPTMFGDEARRKRRRKRRRRRGPGDDNAPGIEAGAAAPGEDDDESEVGESDVGETEGPAEVSAEEAPGEGGYAPGGRKRRRKRRGRLGIDAPRAPIAPVVVAPPPPPPPPAPRRPSQEDIVIDIDEAEMEVVTSEFGELDDIDEFALLDRRQAVIETLQEEVEIEDLSSRDARTAEAEADVDVEDEDETEDETDADTDAEPEAAADAPVEGESETDADGRKRRRRRRRKKQSALAPPELTAPPHKDFWEVWSSKYSFKDFEDSKVGPPPNLEPEPAPPAPQPVAVAASTRPSPAPARPARHSGPPAHVSRPAPSPTADADDSEYTKVLLNLGRVHGHKSSSIRNLLRDSLGLEGRSIRDLTVRDVSTLFRVHDAEIERCQGLLTAIRIDNQVLTLERAENSREDLRAPQPEEFDAVPPGEPTEIRLDPLEFESAMPLVEEPTS